MADLSGLLDELEGELGQVLAPQSNAIPDGDQAAAASGGSGHFFGPYELIELVGQGGVAKVYRATHVNPAYAGQVFAVKQLHEELSRNKQVVDFFQAEAYLLSLLRHPNIVRTFEASSIDSQLYIAMEYVEGRNLEELTIQQIRSGLQIPQQVILHIISEVAKALYFAHTLKDGEGRALGLVHRDVNPANVFLDFNGRVLLGDFGVAVINNANQAQDNNKTMSGKVGYFAPEQFAGRSDYLADIYALGIVLYERLANHILFEGESAEDILKSNRRAKIPSLIDKGISPELDRIVQKILARDPKKRYQSAKAFQQDLQPMLAPASTMKLAVAALMRSLFVTEYTHELLLKEQNYGDELRPDKNPVLVISSDDHTRVAFRDLLGSKGYPVAIIETIDQIQSIIDSGAVPRVILVDINMASFSPLLFKCKLSMFKGQTPAVVAMSNSFSIFAVEAAEAINATDLLFKPYSVERVISTLTAAAMYSRPRQSNRGVTEANVASSFPAPILLVSHHPDIYQRQESQFEASGYKLEPVTNSAELLERLHQKSYKGILYDTDEDSGKYLELPEMIQEIPGLESLPLIYFAEGNLAINLAANLKKRTAVSSSDIRPERLSQTVSNLLGGKYGRCFTRYAQQCQVSLRHGGQLFAGTTENVSRGGLLVRCSAVPAVGAIVGVTLQLPLYNQAIEVRGQVVRVTPTSSAFNGQPGTGVNFLSFAGDSEERLVSYIIYLEENHVTKV